MSPAYGVSVCGVGVVVACFAAGAQPQAPRISLDEYMNSTEIRAARLAPDGKEAVIATDAPDWEHNRFRSDLWIWNESTGETVPLTQSGHDSSPEWSPDGTYVAFLSDRSLPDADGKEGDNKESDDKGSPSRVWIIAVNTGEAFPLFTEKLDVHAFAWSPDRKTILFSVQRPLSKTDEEANKTQWKDVIRWREQERGDLLLSAPFEQARVAAQQTRPPHEAEKSKDAPTLPPLAHTLANSEYEITEIAPAPDSAEIAFNTGSVSHRLEDPRADEIYLVSASGGESRRLTNNNGLESDLHWSPDSKRLFFRVGAGAGSIEGKYRDVQGRLYALDPQTGNSQRLGSQFPGSFEHFAVGDDGRLIAAGLKGTSVQLYRVEGDRTEPLAGLPGSYMRVDAGLHTPKLLLTHSSITDPTQIFLAEDASHAKQANAITAFNPVFHQRAKPEWKAYQWKADDGSTIEGVLIYPPGQMGAKNLRMLTLIHGGPGDADGDHFGADWYDWATLAAANGWLVFRPNYRGSNGYGDDFMLQIAPHIVSRPGKDILEGIDALVADGMADPQHLAIGGYSYGGYMTNWLITQTPRFKAAVTGAGAVEHAANWGNDDQTFDDAWYLGGKPWEQPEIYQSEAALFQIQNVKTPTHIVAGNADVRVSYLEAVLLERALQNLNVAHSLLVFPGEGHPLDKNPWHGYIKVREELQWLDKYTVP